LGRQLHVRIRDRRWVVKCASAETPIAAFDKRDDAVKAAKEIASAQGADVVVFGLDDKPIDGDEDVRT